MKQSMSAEARREHILSVMHQLHAVAQTQQDFTAEKVASASGISTVLLYRYVGDEFKALRNQLPGSRRPADEVLQELRRENADLRQQLRKAKEQLRTTAVNELDEAIRLMERLEEENIQLRSEIRLLHKRLEEGGRVVVTFPQPRQNP